MDYFLPIDLINYEGPDVQWGNAPCTYPNHGPGRLDMGFFHKGEYIYSMTDGVITGIGTYSNGIDTYCHIETSSPLLGTYTIRYLHGDYKQLVKEGQRVSKGDKIGTIGDHTTGDPHLHIDFQIDPMNYDDSSFLGTINYNNRTFIYKGTVYRLTDNIDLNKIRTWNSQRGDSMDNTSIGYMWLIFAQEPQWKDASPAEGGIPIDDTVYKAYSGPYDNSEAVKAYFNATFTEEFFGPPPITWDDFLNNQNLRCLTDFCKRETGAWPFASAVYAKIIRADVLGQYYLNHTCINERQYDTFQEWWKAVIQGSGENWIGSYSMNDGTNCISGDNPLTGTDNDLKYVQAIYNNFRYKNIYGESLHTGTQEFKDKIIMMANGMCPENYYHYETGTYNGGPQMFVINYKPGPTYLRFVGYRNRDESVQGSYNQHAYTLP